MKRQEAIKFVIVRSIGNFLLLFALYGVFATFGPALMYELQYRIIQVRGITFSVEDIALRPSTKPAQEQSNEPERQRNENGFADILAGDTQQILIPKDTDFSISIPKIGASAKIFPNVDPANPNEFLTVLQKGIAHAKGSVFPGMQGNVYLFAHSADTWWNVGRYNAVFYLLQHVKEGDEIVVFFDGKRYEYVVSQTMVSNPEDITLLTQAQGGEKRLVLQTCWPPGTTWKRLYVIAKPKT
jgi:LPXTG-site transpeptidase (sortase) family protein